MMRRCCLYYLWVCIFSIGAIGANACDDSPIIDPDPPATEKPGDTIPPGETDTTDVPDVSDAIAINILDKNGNFAYKRSIKPVNGIGNGPLFLCSKGLFKIDESVRFAELGVPLIRYHDVEYINGQNQAINVSAIFSDFNADASKESSYDFGATDQLLESAMALGCRVIFRLGENIKNTGSATGSNTPPADFKKWARVAERIVAHYEDGWSKGFHYKGIMWEVWNEPDHHLCWNASFDRFCDFYKVVYETIHARHPEADLSPAYPLSVANRRKLYAFIAKHKLGIGHCFSHSYSGDFSAIANLAKSWKQELGDYGLDADVILNEWNYLSPEGQWTDKEKTYRFVRTQEGAAWYAKQLFHMQRADDLAGAVYYVSDMPGYWTGLYEVADWSTWQLKKLPAYDTFKYFGELSRLGYEIETGSLPEYIYVLAASDKIRVGVLVVNYSATQRSVSFQVTGLPADEPEILVGDEPYKGNVWYIKVPLQPYEVTLVKVNY